MTNSFYLGLFRILLVFAVSRATLADNQDTTAETTTSAVFAVTTDSFTQQIDMKNQSNMTEIQKNDSYTMEFIIPNKYKEDQVFLDGVYSKVRTAIVKELNRRPPSDTGTADALSTTTEIVTSIPPLSSEVATTITIPLTTQPITTEAPLTTLPITTEAPLTTLPITTEAPLTSEPHTTVLLTTEILTSTPVDLTSEIVTTVPTTEMTTTVSTTVTTATTTTVSGITPCNRPEGCSKKKRRRRDMDDGINYKNEDVHIVNPEPPVKDDILRMSVYVQREGGSTEPDKLGKALNYLKEQKELDKASSLQLNTIYRGLPDKSPPVSKPSTMATTHILFIVVLLILFLIFIVILILVAFLRHRGAHRTVQKQPLLIEEGPVNVSVDRLSPSEYRPTRSSPSNGVAPPVRRELDDTCGWIIPIDDLKTVDNNNSRRRPTSEEKTHL